MSEPRRLLVLLLSLLVFAGMLSAGAIAAPDGDEGAAPAAEERPLEPKPEEAPASDLPGDRKIYVPFEKLSEIFEKEGQGVFVPYEEFLKLWEANLDRRPVPEKPPVPFLVTRARYEGKVDGDLAVVSAEVEFETFTEGWSAVPLGFARVAMGEATIGGEPATLEATEKGYRVLVPGKGSYVLKLSFVTPVVKNEDLRSVAFRVPPTPVSRLIFDVPEEDARVTVEPNLATTRTDPGSGVTRVMAYAGAAEALSLSWRPKPADVKTGPALVFADMAISASVEEAALRTRADLSLAIYRAPVESVRIEIPEGNRVLFVEGEEIRQWDVVDGVLAVQLHRAVTGRYALVVTLERDRPETGVVPVPSVRVLDVAREQGFVTVRAPETVKAVPAAEGLYRTDFAGLPETLRSGDLAFAWRYPAHPWTLSLAVDRIRPRVEMDGRTTITIDERSLVGQDAIAVNVTRSPVFELRFAVPAGVTVTEVNRDHVEDFRLEGEGDDRVLVLDLKGSRIGGFGIQVTWRSAIALGEDPVPLALPLLTPLGADRVAGMVGIVRDESLKLETGETAGLVPVAAEVFGAGAAVAFRFTEAERSAAFTLSRREPEVTARVDTMLRAEENRIAVTARITYRIRHAGVDEFSFLMPATLKDELRVEGSDIREKPVTDAGDGLARQRIVLQGKVIGEYVVTAEYDLPYPGLAVGDSEPIDVPVLEPENVKRDEGAYAIYREPMLEISAEPERLERIDPRELPDDVDRTEVFDAFKYLVRPHALRLVVTKHEFLPVLTAVVHHMQLVTVLNEEGTARTEVILKMTNNGLQFLTLKPEGPPETLEIIIRNPKGQLIRKSEVPQQGKDGAILVRMPSDAGPDDVFYVKLVTSRRGDLPGLVFHDMEFAAPAVEPGPDGESTVPILGTTWYVYPPVGQKITQAGGTLHWFTSRDSWLLGVHDAIADILPRGGARAERARPDGRVMPGEIADLAPANQPRLEFGGRVQAATVEVTFASPGAFAVVKYLALLLVIAGGVIGLRRRGGRDRSLYVVACVGLPLLFAPVAAPGTAEVLSAVLIAGVIAGAYFLVRDQVVPLVERLKTRDETPPVLEQAPDAPTESDGAAEEE